MMLEMGTRLTPALPVISLQAWVVTELDFGRYSE